MRLTWGLSVGLGLIAGMARDASACGLTPPIGPSGLPTVCRGDVPRVHLGLAVGGTSTRIDFGTGTADLVQGASVVAVDVNPLVSTPLEPLTLTLAGGASLGGRLDTETTRYTISPGGIVGGGLSYRLGGTGWWPFVQPSFALSYASASASSGGASERFAAVDWRAGLAIGKAIGGIAAPFVVGRYFGGGTEFTPEGGHGSDHYRYHVGAGSAFGLSPRVDAVVELAFLGEQRATIGFGYSL